MRQVTDAAYVFLVDRTEARALTERLVAATAKAERLVDPDEERDAFDRRLNAPLGIERARAALLAEAAQ